MNQFAGALKEPVFPYQWTEPMALVILREEQRGRIGKDELLSHLVHQSAKWQLPDEIFFVAETPKTSVGKIIKKMIREVHRDRYMCGDCWRERFFYCFIGRIAICITM